MWKTIAYADIFDYPLTAKEIHRWRIPAGSDPVGKKSPIGSDPIVETDGYYHLRGRKKNIALRRQRERASRVKLNQFLPIIYRLKIIPWIKLICVTGALAMNNADRDDDIDLMIVTIKNRLWVTRLIVSILLFPYLRRGQKINNRLCFNLWLDETALEIKRRNLYIAHEICQAKAVFERDNTYQKFITANLWYKQFLPNWKI